MSLEQINELINRGTAGLALMLIALALLLNFMAKLPEKKTSKKK